MDLGKRNNIHLLGKGKTLMVLAHGFGCDQSMWRLLTPTFQETHQLLLFDLVGSGGSDLTAYNRDKYQTLHGYASDLLEIVDAHAERPVVFVGHSVSAMIGLLASNIAPDRFAAQLMLGPSPCYIDDEGYRGGFTRADIEDLLDTMDGNYLGWSSNMAPAIMGAPDQPELAAELTNSFCRTDPEIARHFARVTFLSDQRADLPLSRTPTLIMQCSDDLIAPMEVGDYMHRAMPHSQLVVIENTGHCPHLSSPAASVAAMQRFLDGPGLT
ncbi:alpha/beta fold hydrolase [Pseudoduganella namucuonensis]|uniref:Sigma-B regulation protein RsbQ n=1 Tax=Pseudoduganella namucuonensis TaxID=1035707 RepID=A0A1I7LXU4_9BURK|nr:alpha/beta hydrolase [Pseudoduganella namucuonensis]SFV14469.1 sigma-B regulation protein RsbQ [Pseudoduganella namucuonensis]